MLQCDLELPVPIEQAFQVFEDPYNLAKITPEDMGFRILTPNLRMQKGAHIDYVFHWARIPLKWKTVISEYDPPYRFVDEALNGPYTYWRHQHTFQATARGTVVSDRVAYGMPFGPLGALVHELSVRKQLLHIFNFRQIAVARLLNTAPLDAKEPSIRRAG